jgi:hypothetical protein
MSKSLARLENQHSACYLWGGLKITGTGLADKLDIPKNLSNHTQEAIVLVDSFAFIR